MFSLENTGYLQHNVITSCFILLQHFSQNVMYSSDDNALRRDNTECKHSTEKPVTTMLTYPTYPWKCTVLHCNHLGNTWKPLVLMIRHFDYCPSASEGDNQSVGSSAPVVSRCFPGGYNVKLYISRGSLAWWLLAFLHSVRCDNTKCKIVTTQCYISCKTV